MPSNSSTRRVLRIGSRDSKLALTQTELVISTLKAHHPGLEIRLETIKTIGDKIQDLALNKIGDKGIFTKELEAALEAGVIDLVVHSLKDMPSKLPAKMALVAITEREDARDALILKRGRSGTLADLPEGSVVGTGSVRRVAQLARQHPHLKFEGIRGNIDTRLAKLDKEDSPFTAIVLAAAGVKRLGLAQRVSELLAVLPAVGQGALGIEAREDDEWVGELVGCLDHRKSRLECLAERELMRVLEGGCSVPLGVGSRWTGDGALALHGLVASVDGAVAVEAEDARPVESDQCAVELGRSVALMMRKKGVDDILSKIRPV
ncbi:hypothetical protein GGI25_005114 [Coemansia spiralis]|uniref:hydroxymethylbilane synthase n=2 Tax=Coemansia TaxID=4863 RepID=A0A9W8FZ61_9FUNG|nr:porphobilinogen deaminase, dipyromethane cofactor binding domain-containing protein [Coemansia spiralis]KAJ1988012.1 hypothetical protein EDC05_005526 [Coemansia umbellata]KAJ2619978.1 hypothetical protein GGI26_005376 [Coemansia sp. RSA 1358]KAJ2672405.1 hypothetical protein GGI25_005114 [Coemansia spiralis]